MNSCFSREREHSYGSQDCKHALLALVNPSGAPASNRPGKNGSIFPLKFVIRLVKVTFPHGYFFDITIHVLKQQRGMK
jgi:hypothetical protein